MILLAVSTATRYYPIVIRSFHDRETAALFEGKALKGVPASLVKVARRKLERLHEARSLNDLQLYPQDKLERLKRDRAGQWSIRINDQFRLCFVWSDGDVERVEFCDYHD
jgi:toxin HigB-1